MEYLLKLILAIALLLLALAGCAQTAATTDTARIVARTAPQIADFAPPAGYTPAFALHALGYHVVAYQTGDRRGQLYLVQSEKQRDGAALEEALSSLAPGYRDGSQMTVVERRPLTIRDQPVTLTISEGPKWGNEPVRQATVVFTGKEGPALLTLLAPTTTWDDAAVDTFLSSIR
jgi:hypothetical protein